MRFFSPPFQGGVARSDGVVMQYASSTPPAARRRRLAIFPRVKDSQDEDIALC